MTGPVAGVRSRPVSWVVTAVAAAALLTGCAQAQTVRSHDPLPLGQHSASASAAPVPEASQGHAAKSSRVRFVPELVTLPGGAHAKVLPAQTVDGVLEVPEQVKHVGWWDGSSYAGDPFGSTVIAGHVDSATEGLGFFARLRSIRVGDKVTLNGDGHSAEYRVVSSRVVIKRALATSSGAFDQLGDPRLVLITCGGDFIRSRGGYDSNLVVTAVPVGLAR